MLPTRRICLLVICTIFAASAHADHRHGLPPIDLSRYRIQSAPEERPFARLEDPDKKAKTVEYVYGDPDDDESEEDDGDVSACKVAPADILIEWLSLDLTEQFSQAHESGLEPVDPGQNPKKLGNALYFGVEAGEPGYATAPGYGNNWDQRAFWSMPAPNSLVSTSVQLRFHFNYDVEPDRDYFQVEWNQGGTWVALERYTGTNRLPSGNYGTATTFDQTWMVQPGEYTGPGANEIQLRLRVLSDEFGSDEDGQWPSRGAAHVDDIEVRFNGGIVSWATFDAPFGSDGWTPQAPDYAGNFAKAMFLSQDLDPCRSNDTCELGFVDDGTLPSNPGYAGGGTGGSYGSWSYGPSGAVVNYTGGVSDGGAKGIHNVAISKRFAFGSAAPDQNGAVLQFDVWDHLPLRNGIFYLWHVRFRGAAMSEWGPWRDHGMVYYSPGAPHFATREIDVSSLMPAQPESVQIALGVIDLADPLGLPGNDATPAPFFDNIAFGRYQHVGPLLHARDQDLFQDAFPMSGSDQYFASSSNAVVRMDAARDIGSGSLLVPADSVVITARALTPGTTLAGPPTMRWAVLRNSVFNGMGWRNPPSPFGTHPLLVGDCNVASVVTGLTGLITGDSITTHVGDPIVGQYAFDLPDGPAHPNAPHQGAESTFFLAGDVLHYFFEAIDSNGMRSTIPEDTTGFWDYRACSPYDPRFTVRALPTVGLGGSQPTLLVLNDHGHGDAEGALRTALAQNGWRRGEDYDYYVVKDPSAGHSNGIGAFPGRGASPDQMAGYGCIAYFAGEETHYLLSEGTGAGGHDKGDDLQLLRDWKDQPADRHILYFGDNLVSGLAALGGQSAGLVANAMKVAAIDDDVRDDVDGQVAPSIAPTGLGPVGLVAEAIAGACFGSDQFDHVQALSPAVRSHEFLDGGGSSGAYAAAASVWHERTRTIQGTGYSRIDCTVPVAFAALLEPSAKVGGVSARAALLGELLGAMGHAPNVGQVTDLPPSHRTTLDQNVPNPFNPRTSIQFSLSHDGRVRLRIVDVRGALVRELVSERLDAGRHSRVWDGRDGRGASVASGVYVVELVTDSQRLSRKLVLVR